MNNSFENGYEKWKKEREKANAEGYAVWKLQTTEGGVEALSKEIENRVNTWLQNNNNFISNAQYRAQNRGNAYVKDSKEWLATVFNQKRNFDSEAENIKSLLNEYKAVFNPEWVNTVNSLLDANSKEQYKVLATSADDSYFWSQFENEEDYNRIVRMNEYRDKYSGKSYEDILAMSNALGDGEEKEWLNNNKYWLLPSASDFADKSQYKSTYRGGEKFSYWTGMYSDTGYDDIMYDYINRDEKAVQRQQLSDIQTDRAFLGIDESERKEMTDEEISIFNYLYATQGSEAAYEFIEYITSDLNARQRATEEAKWAEYAKESPIASSTFSVVTAPLKGLSYLGQFADYVGDGTLEQNAGYNKFSYTSTAIRNEVSKQVESKWGGAGSFAYQTGMSLADFLFTTATTGGGALTLAVMGSGAAADMTISAKDRGLSDEQAFSLGTIAGVAEAAMEKIGLDALFNTKMLNKSVVKYILSNALAEGGEEVGTDVINTIADIFIAQDQSLWQTAINNYMAQGKSESEAFGLALADKAEEMGLSFLGGAISGGVIGGGGVGVNTIGNTIEGSQQKKQYGSDIGAFLADEAVAINPEDSFAKKMQAKATSGKELSSRQVGKLLQQNETGMRENDMETIKSAAQNRLNALGETVDVETLALALAKQASGVELSRKEKNAIKNSKYGQRVANELNPDNINSGEYSSAWAEGIGTDRINVNEYNRQAETDKTAHDDVHDALMSIATETAQVNAEATETTEGEQMSTEGENAVQSQYEVSAEGKTINTKSGEVVNIKNIESISENGEANLTLDDGMVVKASDLSYGTDAEAFFVENIGKIKIGKNPISTTSANALYMTAMSALESNPNMTADEAMSLIKGLEESYIYGTYNFGESKLTASDENGSARLYAGELSQAQRKYAYELGTKDAVNKTEADQKVIDDRKAKAEGKPTKKSLGKIIFEKGAEVADESALTDTQRANLNGIKLLAEISSVEFHVFRSDKNNKFKYTMPDGTVTTANGWFVAGTNQIWIDLNAGNTGEGTMVRTAAHEISHYIKDWSPQKWRAMADMLMETFAKNGVDTESMLNKQIAKIKRRYNKNNMPSQSALTDMAYEELVSDALTDMLTDGSIVNFIAEVKAKDASLGKKIINAIKSLLKKWGLIIDSYKGRNLDTAEAQALSQFENTFKKLQELYRDAFMDANATVAVLNADKAIKLAEVGIGFDETTGEVFQLRDSFATNDKITIGKKSFDIEAVASLVSEVTGRSIEDARKWVNSEMTVANLVMKNPEFLDFEADDRYEAIKKNSDYPQGTVDLSNLCPKRQEFTTMFDILQKKYPNKLFTAADVAEMRNILADNDITVACGACFVEDRRQLLGEIADTYISMWREAVETGNPLHKTNAEGKKIKLTVTSALAKQYGVTKGSDILATDKYIPTQYDLTTYEGFKLLEKNHPTIAMGFNRYNNSRGQQSGRLIEGRAEYKRQILGWSPAKVKSVNNNGGLRIFSFSDFEVVHLLDLVQVIIDCSAMGVKIQGYTKIPAFAKLVRNTGIKLNRSFIPKGETGIKVVNGKRVLDIDAVEGIDYNDKNFLDESDNPDVGNVIIGINPEQIGIAFLDDNIDYVIPFHSNKAKAILKKLGLESWVNYKESQHEKDIATGKASKHNVNIYTQVINKYHPTNKVEFVDAFLEECKRQGKIPRYSEFLNIDENGEYAYREGYHKLLVDFKMFDKEGNILPQGNITPNLNDAFMTELLEAEVDKKANYEFPQEVYDQIEEKFGSETLFSERETLESAAEKLATISDKEYLKAKSETPFVLVMDNTPSVVLDTMIDDNKNSTANNRPILIRRDALYLAIRESGIQDGHYHGLGKEVIKKLPEYLEKPDVILKTDSSDKRRLVLSHIETKSGQAIISVEFESMKTFEGKDNFYNVIVTVFDLHENYLNSLFKKHKAEIKYEKEDLEQLNPQLYKWLRTINSKPSEDSLHQKMETVKEKFSERVSNKELASMDDTALYIKNTKKANYIGMIFNGTKTEETRSQRTLDAFIGKDFYVTDGKMVYGSIVLGEPHKYTEAEFHKLENQKKHRVPKGDEYDIKKGGIKWAYPIESYNKFDKPKKLSDSKEYKNSFQAREVMYSLRDTSSSNRAILANALEGAAQSEIERNKLAQYKEKIALIETEEQRLSEIQKKLFTKGAVEPTERKSLQFEAKQISNRINTYDRQLLNLESTTALKNVLNREKALAMKKQKQRDNEYLKQYKEKVAKDKKVLLERNQESRKKAIEGREKTAMRHKIKSVVNDLNNLLLKPSKERHVPEEMRIAVAEALAIVNMDTVDADTRVAHYNDLIAKAKDPDVIASLTETRDRILNQGNKLAEKLTKLKDAYSMVRDSADDSLRGIYDDVIYSRIESVQKIIGKTPLRNMTLGQLESVYDLYKMVLTTIRDSNKAFAENITQTRMALGSNTFAEIKKGNKARGTIKHPHLEKFLWQNLKPMQAMKTIGSSTLQKLWNNILYGQETFAQDYDEAVNFAKEMKDKHGYEKWNKDRLYSFDSKSGKTMKLTLEQMMSIYAYSKRAQADEHIEYGGIVLNEGVIKVKNKLGKTVEVKVNDSTAYRLNKMQVASIVATLEKVAPGAKAFVDEMQKYLSETMGEKGNEVAMKMYGIKLFKEEHYFPLKSSKDFMEAANAKLKGDVKIKNKGMTKSTVEHARNPIVLENFLDVWGNHINEMAMYHGLVLPLEDFSRTLNYGFKADDDFNTDAESVRTALHDAFGDNADDYLNELLKAINGGVLHDSSAQFADRMISKFKKSKVMASLSVIIQQPTAIIRAMSIIEPKYFVAQNFNHKATWEELKKYCPTAIIKETGSFDTNMGRTIVDMIKDDRGFTDKVGDVLGKAPAYMDEMGWNMMWRALKKKVATEQNLSGEALLRECGKQMTLILNETQVYDSVMSRNELMRSKSAFTKMATAFMAEPTTVANMIYGAALDFKRGKRGVATKTVAATIASVVINSLVSAIVYAMRDDDEEKTFLEKYISSATTEVVDGLNPLTYIPFVKDAYSLFQGYDVERTDMALIGDVVDAINDFYTALDPEEYEGMSEEETAKHIYENSVPLLTAICDMFGLPVGNVLRDAEAIIVQDNAPMSQTSPTGTLNAFKEGILSSLPQIVSKVIGTESKQDQLYDAIVSGDTAYIERLKSGYKDEASYETAVRKALRENDERIKEAAEAYNDGDIRERDRILDEIVAEGFFDEDLVFGAITAEANALKSDAEEESEAEEDKATSIYKADDVNVALESGDKELALEIIDDLVKTKVENGMEEDKAKSSVKSSVTSYWKPLYKAAYKNKDNEEMTRIRKLLLDSGLYGRASQVSETCRDWIKELAKDK